MLYAFQLPSPYAMVFFFPFVYLYGGAYEAESMLMTRKRHSTFFFFFTKHFLQNKIPIFLPRACMESFYCTCVFEHGILGLGGK